MSRRFDFVVSSDGGIKPLAMFLKEGSFNCYSKRDAGKNTIVQLGNERGCKYQPYRSILVIAPYPVKAVEDAVRARLCWEPLQ